MDTVNVTMEIADICIIFFLNVALKRDLESTLKRDSLRSDLNVNVWFICTGAVKS